MSRYPLKISTHKYTRINLKRSKEWWKLIIYLCSPQCDHIIDDKKQWDGGNYLQNNQNYPVLVMVVANLSSSFPIFPLGIFFAIPGAIETVHI
jgi:hypothetical protein